MRVGVHGLIYTELLYGFSRVYYLFSILCGLIIFEYTDSNIFLTYGMVEMWIEMIGIYVMSVEYFMEDFMGFRPFEA